MGGHRGRHNPPVRAKVGCAPLRAPLWYFFGLTGVRVKKNSPESFVVFGIHFVLIFCDVKNMQKTATGTWHYVNRLVPKNDIK